MHCRFWAWSWRLAATVFDPSWWWFGQLAGSELAFWWLPEPRWFALPLALLGAFWLLLPLRVPGKPLALLLWLPLLWPQRDLPRHGEAELVVLDVGQGLSVLVRTANHALLYDMGPAVPDGFDAGERVVVPALHALGVQRLDAAVVSHGDNDHAGGYPAVERMLLVGRTLTPEGAGVSPRAQPCLAGMTWHWDGVTLRFLHPPLYFPYLGNEAGCVLRVETAHGTALLTGDIGEVIERRLLRMAPSDLRADIVLVPHHAAAALGSGSCCDPPAMRWSPPPCNRFHHPRGRWSSAGRTARGGAGTIGSGALRHACRHGHHGESRRAAHPGFGTAARPGQGFRGGYAILSTGLMRLQVATSGLQHNDSRRMARAGTGQGGRMADDPAVAAVGAGAGDHRRTFLVVAAQDGVAAGAGS